MQTQKPKVTITKTDGNSDPPKSKRPRRTKAEMAASRTLIDPSILTTMSAEDTAVSIAKDLSRALGPSPRRLRDGLDAQWIAIGIAVVAILVSMLALLRH